MPIQLPPISRRRFLAGAFAATAGLLAPRLTLAAEPQIDPHRFALLADTHIFSDPEKLARGINMFDHLRQVCNEIAAAEPRPAAILINGDCAFNTGEADDYATLLELLLPIRKLSLPIHLTLGNHDHRDRFFEAHPLQSASPRPLRTHHVAMLESPRANFFLLDSLDQTNVTPGLLGQAQLDWLASALDDRNSKPALIFMHHNPDEKPQPTGLIDTAPLLNLLLPRKHVKALFFGHTHTWSATHREGLHLINLPPTSYVFQADRPSGWIDMRLAAGGATLQLHCIDPVHPQHLQETSLTWRP